MKRPTLGAQRLALDVWRQARTSWRLELGAWTRGPARNGRGRARRPAPGARPAGVNKKVSADARCSVPGRTSPPATDELALGAQRLALG